MERSNTSYDVLTLGRVGVDLYPLESGVSLDQVGTFRRFLGGSPTNVAVAAAKLGLASAVVTKVGDDPFGRYVREAIAGFGVDSRFVSTHPRLRTPLAFCELHPPDNFPLLFYREPIAPDLTLEPVDLDRAAIEASRIVWTTGTGLSAEPSRSTTLEALDISRGTRIHDLDYRETFWPSVDEASEQQRRALEKVDVAVGNLEECAVAVGEGPPGQMAARILELGVETVVIKRGPEGVSAFRSDTRVDVDPVSVEIVNGLGAGDAFGGALCFGLLAKWSLQEVLTFANAAGAHVAGQLACADAMPDESTIRSVVRSARAS